MLKVFTLYIKNIKNKHYYMVKKNKIIIWCVTSGTPCIYTTRLPASLEALDSFLV